MATPIDVDVLKCRKICQTGNRRNRELFTSQKKISAASQTVATARIASKICQGEPQHLAHNVLDFIQIGSLTVKL